MNKILAKIEWLFLVAQCDRLYRDRIADGVSNRNPYVIKSIRDCRQCFQVNMYDGNRYESMLK